MLTGYIEQEILEGRFWYFWLHCRPNDSGPMDLQDDEGNDDRERSDINQSDADDVHSRRSNQSR